MTSSTYSPKVDDFIILGVTPWLADKKGFPSPRLTGKVLASTSKALLLRGHAHIGSSSNCFRCGRVITNPLSLWCGYGPICSDLLGIPRDATGDQLEEVRRSVAGKTFLEEWIPLSQIKEMTLTSPESVELFPEAYDDDIPF